MAEVLPAAESIQQYVSRSMKKMSYNRAGDMESKPKHMQVGRLKVDRAVALVHFNIFLYSTCFWIQQGVFPYLSNKLEASTLVFGYLQTTFAAVQLAGGPLFGRFGDVYGGRSALVLAFASASLSYGILGCASSIEMLFLSRLPSICMHAMQGGQMVVTDLADTSKRVDALGKLAISYGVGMVIGPVVGGVIGTYVGLRAAALIACFGSIFSAVLCHTLLPRCAKKPSSSRPAADTSLFNIYKLGQVIKKKKAITLLTVRFVTGVPIGIFQSMFAVVAMEMYGLNAAQNGYLMSYIGILSMLVQGLCMGELNKHFNEIQLIKGGVLILMWAYLFLMLVDTVWQLCLVFIPLVFGLSVLTVVISAALTHSVPDEDTGAILGINMAVNSLIRTLSPTLGGFLLQTFGFGSFGFLGFVQSIATSVYLSFRFQDKGTVIQKDSVTQTDVNHCLGKAATAP